MKLTLEQHRELGEKLKEFRETMMQPHVLNVETKSSRESRATHNVLEHLDRLKNVLDSLVCREFPECKDATQIYYGETSARKAKLSNNKAFSKNQLRDQFAGLAMQGMISTVEGEPACEWIARTSYEMADAMLEARGRHPFC